MAYIYQLAPYANLALTIALGLVLGAFISHGITVTLESRKVSGATDAQIDQAHATITYQADQINACPALVEDWTERMLRQDLAGAIEVAAKLEAILKDVVEHAVDPVPDALLCEAHEVKHGPELVRQMMHQAHMRIVSEAMNDAPVTFQ